MAKLSPQELLQKQLKILYVHASRAGAGVEDEAVRMIHEISDDGSLPEQEYHDAPVSFDELLRIGGEIDVVKNGLIELYTFLEGDDIEVKSANQIILLN